MNQTKSSSPAKLQPSLATATHVDCCSKQRCSAHASTACALCGQAYCAHHCRRIGLYTVFRLRTDLPEDLIDLLNGISEPRARIWVCEPCEKGAPYPGGASWT